MAEIPVDAGLSNKSIEGLNTEDDIPNEGKITYDIKFYVILPDGEHTKIIINIEAQKDSKPGYDLVTRAVFYCARLLSAQLDKEKKKRKLEEDFELPMTVEFEQKVEEMCNLSGLCRRKRHT